MIRRREFLSGSVPLWLGRLTVRAQQPATPVVRFLGSAFQRANYH